MTNRIKNWFEEHLEVVGGGCVLCSAVMSLYFGYKIGTAATNARYGTLMIRNPEIKKLCEKARDEIISMAK